MTGNEAGGDRLAAALTEDQPMTGVDCPTCGPDRTFDDPADCPTCAGERRVPPRF